MDDAPPKPLLRYAEELQRSYSRLIVHSGDILRALPEPRGGLSAANIKAKKDETSMFQREWQHLESVLDEYLIRLNDIRTRAHDELDAARVRCLVGEDVDLTLPEAAAKLRSRLVRYKRQYGALQQVLAGTLVGDLEDMADTPGEQGVEMETKHEDVAAPATLDTADIPIEGAGSQSTAVRDSSQGDPEATKPVATDVERDLPDVGTELIDIDGEDDDYNTDDYELDDDDDNDVLFQEPDDAASSQPIELGSGSEIDDDAMEDIFE